MTFLQALRNGRSHDSDTNLEKLRAKRSILNKRIKKNQIEIFKCRALSFMTDTCQSSLIYFNGLAYDNLIAFSLPEFFKSK